MATFISAFLWTALNCVLLRTRDILTFISANTKYRCDLFIFFLHCIFSEINKPFLAKQKPPGCKKKWANIVPKTAIPPWPFESPLKSQWACIDARHRTSWKNYSDTKKGFSVAKFPLHTCNRKTLPAWKWQRQRYDITQSFQRIGPLLESSPLCLSMQLLIDQGPGQNCHNEAQPNWKYITSQMLFIKDKYLSDTPLIRHTVLVIPVSTDGIAKNITIEKTKRTQTAELIIPI